MTTAFTVRYARIDSARIQRRLVRNAAYCADHVSLNGWCHTPLTPARTKPKFFEAMRESVQREGFRNPIVVYALPEGIMLSFGGSRLRVAHELGLPIPCIVADYTGEFDGAPEVTEDNYASFFVDVPQHFAIDGDGVDTHYSLERNRRNEYDAAGMAWADASPNKQFLEEEFPWIQKALT